MRFDLSIFGAALLAAMLGSSGAWAFSEQTVGGASTGNGAQYQDVDDMLKATPFDTGTSTDKSSNLSDKSSETTSKSGFSFSAGSDQSSGYQPYGPWTIPRR